jgi:hypothetical protein
MDDRFDVTALKARLAAAAASGWGTPSPSAARQEADALRRWRAEHPEPERKVEIESTDTEEKPAPKQRRPTLAAALKQASKAGQYVSGAVIEDGKIELKFGKQVASDEAADELAKWRKRRAGHAQGH